ncbi:hypothetical protein ACC754_40980, partial [Rhizobium johnstonii]
KNDNANLEWDASGRARVGYAWYRTLFFATAGVAAGGGKVDNGPMEVPGGSWIIQATDPQGAFFCLVAPKR